MRGERRGALFVLRRALQQTQTLMINGEKTKLAPKNKPSKPPLQDILNLCYVCDSLGLKECSAYWFQVIAMNDYQKARFVERGA